jgi:hypothetical protein
MRVESVNTPSLLELRAIVAQRLQAYGAFEACTAEDQRTILAQACMVIVHLTAGEEGRLLYRTHLSPPADWACHQTVLDTLTRLCPDVIAAVQGYIAAWRARFWRDGWHPTQWEGCCDGINVYFARIWLRLVESPVIELASLSRRPRSRRALDHADDQL